MSRNKFKRKTRFRFFRPVVISLVLLAMAAGGYYYLGYNSENTEEFQLSSNIIDEGLTIPLEIKRMINQQIELLKQELDYDLLVMTLNDNRGRDIDHLATRIMDSWERQYPPSAGIVLLLVVTQTEKPDEGGVVIALSPEISMIFDQARIRSIIRDTIIPFFVEADKEHQQELERGEFHEKSIELYASGLSAGVREIVNFTISESKKSTFIKLLAQREENSQAGRDSRIELKFFLIFLTIIFTLAIIFSIISRYKCPECSLKLIYKETVLVEPTPKKSGIAMGTYLCGRCSYQRNRRRPLFYKPNFFMSLIQKFLRGVGAWRDRLKRRFSYRRNRND